VEPGTLSSLSVAIAQAAGRAWWTERRHQALDNDSCNQCKGQQHVAHNWRRHLRVDALRDSGVRVGSSRAICVGLVRCLCNMLLPLTDSCNQQPYDIMLGYWRCVSGSVVLADQLLPGSARALGREHDAYRPNSTANCRLGTSFTPSHLLLVKWLFYAALVVPPPSAALCKHCPVGLHRARLQGRQKTVCACGVRRPLSSSGRRLTMSMAINELCV